MSNNITCSDRSVILLMGTWELKWFVPASQCRAISSSMLSGPEGNVLKLTSSPLLERLVKKYISSVVGTSYCPSSMKASASGCQYSTKAFSSLGCACINGYMKNLRKPHCINAATTSGSPATNSLISSCSLSL
jgi:hypothetical protein